MDVHSFLRKIQDHFDEKLKKQKILEIDNGSVYKLLF